MSPVKQAEALIEEAEFSIVIGVGRQQFKRAFEFGLCRWKVADNMSESAGKLEVIFCFVRFHLNSIFESIAGLLVLSSPWRAVDPEAVARQIREPDFRDAGGRVVGDFLVAVESK